MGIGERIGHEMKSVGVAMLFFGCWIGALLVLKHLILAEHQIRFYGYGAALVGAFILAKVVIVLEHVSLGAWVRSRPAALDVCLRTLLYASGVVVVMAIEHGVRGRSEHGGFLPAVEAAIRGASEDHFWADAFCVGGALLVWNIAALVRRRLGSGAIVRMLLEPAGATDAPTWEEHGA